MKKVWRVSVCIMALLLACLGLSACKDDETPSYDKDQTWSKEDSYSLSLTDGKVVSDKDYVICLEKDKDKDFVILNMSDIQLGVTEIDVMAEQTERAKATIKELIERVQPDLITITGDQGYGTKRSILYIGNLIDAYGIPWAPVYGNHDNQEETDTTGQQAYLYENSFRNCLFQGGAKNLAVVAENAIGYGNYIVNVVEKDATARGFHVVKSLLFVNSGENMVYKAEEYPGEEPINDHNYAMLTDTQKEWYKWAIQKVQPYGTDGMVSSAMFLHIPIYAYNTAWANKNADSIGEMREAICSSPYDDHVFEIMQDFDENPETTYKSTDLIVAGHDHINDFVVEYEGTQFVYGLKTGSGCYYNKDMSGGTKIVMDGTGNCTVSLEFVDVYAPILPYWLIAVIIVVLAGISVLVYFLLKRRKQKKLKNS